MKKVKTPTPTTDKKKMTAAPKSQRKNSNASTREGSRQRSGNNGPQQGSH